MNQLIIRKELIIRQLKKYNIPCLFSIKPLEGGIENTNLLIETQSQKFVLRIYNNKTIPRIKSEISLIGYLVQRGVPAPISLPTSKGGFIVRINSRPAVLFSHICGEHVPKGQLNRGLAGDIGINLGLMQKALLHFRPGYLKEFSQSAFFGGRVLGLMCPKELTLIKKKIKGTLKDIPYSRLRREVIHSDITRENLIVQGRKVKGIIDFDDSHLDYLSYDTAVAITQLFVTKTNGIDWSGLKHFIEGYIGVITLNPDELRSIIPFMMLRNFQLACYTLKKAKVPGSNKLVLNSIAESALFKIHLIDSNKERLQRVICGGGT